MEPQLRPSTTVIRTPVPLVIGPDETDVLDGALCYDTADPFAVTLEVVTESGPVIWTFARDLLSEGRYGPCGDGDVQVWPCLSITASAVTIIELHAPRGDALLQAATRTIDRFLTYTYLAVPPGQESKHLALDGLVAQLLA